MIGKLGLAMMAAAIAASPVSAQMAQPLEEQHASATMVRELDVMLMVTALRCRFGAEDFMADYSQFVERHRDALGQANAAMLADLSRTHGEKGAANALDRISIGLANRYGNGHPWLECGALKQVAQELALTTDPSALNRQAAYLLGKQPYIDVQLAAR